MRIIKPKFTVKLLLVFMIVSLFSLSMQYVSAQSVYDWSGKWEESTGYIMNIEKSGDGYIVWVNGDEEFKGSKFTGTAEGDTLVINMDWSGGSFVPFGTIMNYRLIMSPDGNSITAYGTPYGKLEQQVIFTAKRMSGSPIDLQA